MTGRDLGQAIQYAAAESRLRDRIHRLAFLNNHRGFRVERQVAGATAEFVSAEGLAGRTRTLADGTAIAAIESDGSVLSPLPDALEFFPDGSGFSGTIRLADRSGHTSRIDVISKTGQVNVSE
jgi:hypothetical protein